MSVMRFLGVNSREAMRQVRDALGDDALILSNQRVEEGVEVVAVADEVQSSLVEQAEPVAAPASSAPGQDRLYAEMQAMRELLMSHIAETPRPRRARPGVHGVLRQRLITAGFSARLVREMLAALPDELSDVAADDPRLLAWTRRQLETRLAVLDDEAAMLEDGGVFALVGPTGVGKTTTTAKFAARYVMRFGGEDVALVTTDDYRIGAHEQLRIYARLLGVDVHAVHHEDDLEGLLSALEGKRMVIVDTVGMSQRDQRVAGQIARLGGAGRPVRRLLLLNAASHGDTLEEVAETYQRASRDAGAPLYGCLLTKVDEAPRLGAALDVVMRHGLRLYYVSHGQRVPEDIRLAEAPALLDEALAVGQGSPFTFDENVLTDMLRPTDAGQDLQALSRDLMAQRHQLMRVMETLQRDVPGMALMAAAWRHRESPRAMQQTWLESHLTPPPMVKTWREAQATGLFWPGGRPRGMDWMAPMLPLDAHGDVLPMAWPLHRWPPSDTQRLTLARRHLGSHWHVFARMPDVEVRQQLQEAGSPWLARARVQQRVWYAGERLAIGDVVDLAESCGQHTCRLRGRERRVTLACLPVSLTADDTEALQLWIATSHDPESGRQRGVYHWLGHRGDALEIDMRACVYRQLEQDDLLRLMRTAWQQLGASMDCELRVYLAAQLAALSLRMELSDEGWAVDTRPLVKRLAGERKRRSPETLLHGLMHLLTAHTALSQAS
ncbi:flagellar biosynthesis protein FlhF [Chromohalobacter marismortui]|uniref:Flagellar biosynthesis protein FlhF n=1 Tax=Chromohalobacter marismortui TaxID=42055 RepID=A0A4R7NQP8_9GAMM|nr:MULTISPECIES: flagellar biosynthesis protein FlhF [Chromohalobacter]MCI0508799.1 flagellar biosynthesis protein FlhF [Chromohalobacter sp.]MCI0592003.1 flagellar biosynthesis protein FlhF [Chromohalobacter sp.]TDU22831.1 flagellar biosynthesis protein FlhF [Chromohalobacter marismortui]